MSPPPPSRWATRFVFHVVSANRKAFPLNGLTPWGPLAFLLAQRKAMGQKVSAWLRWLNARTALASLTGLASTWGGLSGD